MQASGVCFGRARCRDRRALPTASQAARSVNASAKSGAGQRQPLLPRRQTPASPGKANAGGNAGGNGKAIPVERRRKFRRQRWRRVRRQVAELRQRRRQFWRQWRRSSGGNGGGNPAEMPAETLAAGRRQRKRGGNGNSGGNGKGNGENCSGRPTSVAAPGFRELCASFLRKTKWSCATRSSAPAGSAGSSTSPMMARKLFPGRDRTL